MYSNRGLHGLAHPLTGAPISPLGYTRAGKAIWPVMGGSQPTGGDTGTPGPPPQQHNPQQHNPPPGHPGPQPGPPPGNPMFPPPGNPAGQQPPPGPNPMTAHLPNNENGYPDHTPVQSMNPEQQAAYWRTYARRNEDRIKAMGDYAQLKEAAEAYQKLLTETQTDQQKAVAQAEARGRSTALAEAGSQMVEAYVRAAATGRMNDEQVNALLQGLDRNRFVNPANGQVDAQMINGYVAMLAPANPPGWPGAPAYAPPVPATGQVQYPPGNTYGGMQPGQQPGQPAPQLTYPPQQPGQPMPWGVYPPAAAAAHPQQQPAQPVQPGQQPVMGDGRQVPSYGQAQFGSPPVSGLEAGKAIARARFAKPAQQ